MIEKFLAMLLLKKGLALGFGIGIMQILLSIRERTFRWSKAITTLIGATFVGYVAWEVGTSASLSMATNTGWTVFLSANAFVLISIISDKKFLEQIFKSFIDKKLK